jgi:hypothetical protein
MTEYNRSVVQEKGIIDPTIAVDTNAAVTLRMGRIHAKVLLTILGMIAGDPDESFRRATDRWKELLESAGVTPYEVTGPNAMLRGIIELRSRTSTTNDPDSGFLRPELYQAIEACTGPMGEYREGVLEEVIDRVACNLGTEPALTDSDDDFPDGRCFD